MSCSGSRPQREIDYVRTWMNPKIQNPSVVPSRRSYHSPSHRIFHSQILRPCLSQSTSKSSESLYPLDDPSVRLCSDQLSPRVSLDPANPKLTDEQRKDLLANIQLLRDTIVLFTASAAARGVSGHTGGAYDTIPEVTLLLSLFENSDKYVKIFFDEAGAISPRWP